jgi:hypothetical protein
VESFGRFSDYQAEATALHRLALAQEQLAPARKTETTKA